MPKSLEELLKIKKWTGKDAGLLYLYSTKNDILNSRFESSVKFPVSQDKFNTILKKISVVPKEYKEFTFYSKFQYMVMDIEKLSRFYNEQLNHHILKLNTLLETIYHDKQTEKKIMNLNISDEEKADIISNLDSASFQETLFNTFDKEYIEEITEGYKLSRKIIIKDLSYFYSLEFVFSNILKRYDLEFLEEIMRQQVPFHGYINNLNLNYEKIQDCLTNKERRTFNEIYIPIDYNKLYPTNEDIPDSETGEKITIEELDFLTPEDIKTFVLELSNIMTSKYLGSK